MNVEQVHSVLAARKENRFNIGADEREQIISLLRRLPLAQVKAQTGRPYVTLCRIAEAAGI